jgi:hypothetical protein
MKVVGRKREFDDPAIIYVYPADHGRGDEKR